MRFESTDSRILYGEPILPQPDFDLGLVTEADKLQVKVLSGSDIFDTTGTTKITDEVVTLRKLLGPLVGSEVPAVRCVGLNYAKHSKSKSQERRSCFSPAILTACNSPAGQAHTPTISVHLL